MNRLTPNYWSRPVLPICAAQTLKPKCVASYEGRTYRSAAGVQFLFCEVRSISGLSFVNCALLYGRLSYKLHWVCRPVLEEFISFPKQNCHECYSVWKGRVCTGCRSPVLEVVPETVRCCDAPTYYKVSNHKLLARQPRGERFSGMRSEWHCVKYLQAFHSMPTTLLHASRVFWVGTSRTLRLNRDRSMSSFFCFFLSISWRYPVALAVTSPCGCFALFL